MECLLSDPRIIDCILERDRYGLRWSFWYLNLPPVGQRKENWREKMCFVVSLRSVQY